VNPRPRLLLIGPTPEHLNGTLAGADVVAVPDDPEEVARRLRDPSFDAVVAGRAATAGLLDRFGRGELVLGHIDKGIAVLDPAGTVLWANPEFARCCGSDPTGRPVLFALGGTPRSDGGEQPADPLAPLRSGRPTSVRLHRPDTRDQPHLELDLRPVLGPDGSVAQVIALVRDVTAEVTHRQKLDALHAAGRELAGLDAELLAEMNVASRVELLRQNLRRYVRDLLHYDTIEVRVLVRKTGELKPLLDDGMTPEAANRVLFARPTGNGVTGYVAYTGKSYLCPDTAHDPLYIRGAEGARSSMTIPLKYHEEVVGTLNVESPRVNGFGPDDLQFTELFSREVAGALHTLDLLSAQEECTASQSIEAVNREIALPLDQVLASACVLLRRADTDPAVEAELRRIVDAARQVKDRVGKVGRDMTPAPTEADETAPLAGKRVLVVEPDNQTRRQAHLLLTRLGAKVETAGTAAEGLAMAASGEYDAIFQDVKPPDMGGYECYRRLKATRPESTVALTTGFGYDVAHSIVKARQDGMKYVLFKPFRPDQVVRAVLDETPQEARPEAAGKA
jgi:CheY-like chemotaxis protein/PAS domain-containing protein